MDEGDERGVPRCGVRVAGKRGDVLAAGAVDVEEESRLRCSVWEGGEVHSLLVPLVGVCVWCVSRAEPVGEAWVVCCVGRGGRLMERRCCGSHVWC